MYKLLLILFGIALGYAQTPGAGNCPPISPVKNLDIPKFSGKWFVQERINAFFDIGKCINHNLMGVGFGFFVTSTGVDKITNVTNSYVALASTLGDSFPGIYGVVYPTVQLPIPLPYQILQTDYTSYSVIYSCIDLQLAHIKFAWILTRDRMPVNNVMESAHVVTDGAKIDRNLLTPIDQVNCPPNI